MRVRADQRINNDDLLKPICFEAAVVATGVPAADSLSGCALDAHS